MHSALLECRLVHHRLHPKVHRFRNRLFFLAIDLSEIDVLSRRLALFSRGRANLFSLYERDFLRVPGEPPSPDRLLARTRTWLRHQGIAAGADLRVVLVAIPRIVGYQFNPVCFYFCYAGDAPLCAIAEVTNTFRESKLYLLPPESRQGSGSFRRRLPKDFDVSPYSDAGLDFEFRLGRHGGRIDIRISEWDGATCMLRSALVGTPRPLSNRRLAWYAVKYPFLSLQVMIRIHTQALRLYFKRLPWWRKRDQAGLQRDYCPPTGRGDPAPANPSLS